MTDPQQVLMPSVRKTISPTKSEVVAAYLQAMSLPSMWPRVLSDSDYVFWESALDPYSTPAIKFAFETWIHGGKRFPVVSDIEPLCASYGEQQQLARHAMEKKVSTKKTVLSPELVIALLPEIIQRCNRYYAEGIDPAPPYTEDEVDEMVAKARIRSQTSSGPMVKRFPNGNPIMNIPLTQARALLSVK